MTDQCGKKQEGRESGKRRKRRKRRENRKRRKRQKKGRESGSQTANESGGSAEEVGDQEERGMQGFPVELIGNILSRVTNVKDLVRASWTCRKWRLALRHLHSLRLFYSDEPEKLLTKIVLQTVGLQELRIVSYTKFSVTAADAWLLHTRESLRRLVLLAPLPIRNVNMLEGCGRMKCLQSLDVMTHGEIRFTTDPTAQLFPCLLSLSLSRVKMSGVELQSLVSGCPKLESVYLGHIEFSDLDLNLKLRSFSLKSFEFRSRAVDSVILEANLLKKLRLHGSNFTTFQLKTGARLRSLEFDDVTIPNLELGNNTNFLDEEELEVRGSCNGVWAAIASLFSKPSSKLRKLQLVPLDAYPLNLDLETIACLFPNLDSIAWLFRHLNHLLSSRVVDNDSPTVESQFQGSTVFEGVQFFELGYPLFDATLVHLMGGALKRCPNLRKLMVKIESPIVECESS